MRTPQIAGVCLLLLLSSASAQERIVITTDRDAPPLAAQGFGMDRRPPRTGTAHIRGRVIAADSAAGLRRAQVRISGAEVGSRLALTDQTGHFAFEGLPAGRVILSASKPGFVSIQYGQTRPFESGTPIELADGQLLDRADITLPRGSVIAGRVLDEFGDPVADAMVTGMRSVWANGRRRLQPFRAPALTNDLGQFRLYGLTPGDYYVSATVRDAVAMEMSMASMSGAASPPPGSQPPASGYAPTYFPGTPVAAEAQKVTVAVGQEAQGIDFALAPVRLTRISGTAITSQGKPADGSMVTVVPRGDVGFFGMMGGNARTGSNGAFTLAGLPPGDYILQVIGVQIMTAGGGNSMITARIGGPGGPDGPDGPEMESASVPITVGAEDVSNLVIVTSKGTTATGQVIFEGGAKPPGGGGLRVAAMPAVPEVPTFDRGALAPVKTDGTFELRGLSGVRLVRPSGFPPGWMLKSVQVNGADITDTGMEFKGGDVTGLEVVLTPKATEVSGTVAGPSGRPLKDDTVVLFSDDPQRWLYPATRFVVGTRPNQEGRFEVKALPAGTYYAAAVDYLPQGEWGDPEVLDRLKRIASTFTLDEGETRTLALTLK